MSNPESTVPEYLKLSELKAALEEVGHHITTRQLRNLCNNGKIKAAKRNGGLYKVHRDEARRVLETIGSKPSRENPDRPRIEQWTERDALRVVMRRYGITEDEYAAMCEAVNHRCTLCKCKPEDKYADRPKKAQRLFVDHDHATGRIRGLLCAQCNAQVSFAGDSPEKIRRLLDYVEGRITPAAQLTFFDRSA